MTGPGPDSARDAGTVVLLRPAEGPSGPPRVLLLERPNLAAFAPGTQVFPGGSVDAADKDPSWSRLLPSWSNQGSDPRAPLALRLAAVRETYEEAGILLSRRRDGSRPSAEDIERLSAVRAQMRAGRADEFRVGLTAANLIPDVEELTFCAHWVTPPGLPRRFDTRFFLAPWPLDQEPQPDPLGEHVSLRWVTPAIALEEARQGRCQLLPPTRAVLEQLTTAHSVDDAMAHARAATVETIRPLLEDVTEERYPGLDVSRLHRE
ncbi:MAG: NUDIX hydrolase [Candidatus Dormibacteria bacterium]